MSKILKAEEVASFEIYKPKGVSLSEETFIPFFEPETSEDLIETSKQEEEPREDLFKLAYEEGYRKGYEEGFNIAQSEGYKRGYEKGLEEAKNFLERERKSLEEKFAEKLAQERAKIEAFLKKAQEELESLVLDLNYEILELALSIAKKICLKEIERDRELLQRIIKEALTYLIEGIEVIIRVNPEDYVYLVEGNNLLGQNYKIKFLSDPSISRGGLIIESKLGHIDATLEKRWKILLEQLEDAS